MQIIQGIREKGAAVVIGVIALSLIGFILMDAKSGSNKLFGSSSTTSIARVNREDIDLAEYNKKVKMQEDQEKQQSQQPFTTARSYQIKDQVWNQMVALKIFYAEAAKLGIDFTGKEMESIIKSDDPSNPLKQDQSMVDSATGMLDQSKVAQVISNYKKSKGEQRDFYDSRLYDPLRQSSVVNKYNGLLGAAAYYPAWMQEKDTKQAKEFANISYVAIPYNVIPDSSVKVTDAEVEEYVKKHKKLFKQEEGRAISYVIFSQLPSSDDSLQARTEMEKLKPEFAKDTNNAAFLAKNSSKTEFEDVYKPKSKITTANIDSIVKVPAGTVYGPYVDGKNYSLAKVLGSKTLPDSVKARHILIPTNNLPDSVAKKLADSILAAVKGGASFEAMAKKYGSDATKDKGGDLGTFGYGSMVAEFNDFSFNKPVGTIDIVKTQYGYHVVKIENQKNFNPAYKLAIFSKEITAGEATTNAASLSAIKLSGEKTAKNFDSYIAKNGLKKITWPTLIKESDYQIGTLQDARQLVHWVYEAKEGDVSEPFQIGDNYVVAVLDNVYSEGTQDVKRARPMAEGAIRSHKIADMIIQKIGNNPTLEATGSAYNKQVQTAGTDSSITFNSTIINGIGPESKVIGASFNKDNQSKASTPIEGKTGIYVVKVNGISMKAAETPAETEQKAKTMIGTIRGQVTANWYEGLKNEATIKDNRGKVNY